MAATLAAVPNPRSRCAALLVVVTLLSGACAGEDQRPSLQAAGATTAPTTSIAPTTTAAPVDPHLSTVAYSTITGEVPIYPTAAAAEADRTLQNPTPIGAPLVLLVKEDLGDWLEVYLPMRPNGSTGFVPEADVELRTHRFHITVRLAEFNIKVAEGDEILLDTEIGVARENAPTPGGLYYTTELLAPPNPAGSYGPYAYGLSGFSETYQTFNEGPGQLGIHGTNQPDRIGTAVSSGCIRLRNEDITRMAEELGLPLGVPVTIIA